MERLFFGVPLPADAREAIQASLAGLDLPGRSVQPANWHLTLRFLGDTTPETREVLIRHLDDLPLGGRFQVEFGGLGAFPKAGRARVLWLGVSRGADRLAELARACEEVARRAGFASEGKPFRAHLTLARLHPPRSVAPLIAKHPEVRATMQVDALVLFRSHLGGGPARYERVHQFPLGKEADEQTTAG